MKNRKKEELGNAEQIRNYEEEVEPNNDKKRD